jgi:hypothetical protein
MWGKVRPRLGTVIIQPVIGSQKYALLNCIQISGRMLPDKETKKIKRHPSDAVYVLPKINNHTRGENSPNVVAPLEDWVGQV